MRFTQSNLALFDELLFLNETMVLFKYRHHERTPCKMGNFEISDADEYVSLCWQLCSVTRQRFFDAPFIPNVTDYWEGKMLKILLSYLFVITIFYMPVQAQDPTQKQ